MRYWELAQRSPQVIAKRLKNIVQENELSERRREAVEADERSKSVEMKGLLAVDVHEMFV